MKLDLGCGGSPHDGYLAVDNNPLCNPAFLHDLNVFPYPFEDNSVDEILMNGVLEHLDDVMLVVQEMYRITKPMGIWKITVPHYTKSMQNPTHKRGFVKQWWNLVNANHPRKSEKYLELDIDVVKEKYIWMDNASGIFSVMNRVFSTILNYNSLFTDRFLSFWLGGIDNIYFEVVVIKGSPYDKGIAFKKRLMRR